MTRTARKYMIDVVTFASNPTIFPGSAWEVLTSDQSDHARSADT
jgi:hypothetical protein